jgi:hypothetical protein
MKTPNCRRTDGGTALVAIGNSAVEFQKTKSWWMIKVHDVEDMSLLCIIEDVIAI